ncbi:MAG: DUF2336 domain-containing protein [Pseudorhodoplanes sp.]
MTVMRRSLISELDDAVRNGSKDERVDTLRRITDLFLAESTRLSEEQISIFDDVIGHLMKRVEHRWLTELSERLAPINNAPNNVVQTLARNDEIAIAGPVLTFSVRLTSSDLIEIAKSKPQGHLRAIACRTDLGPSVTDALLERGDDDIRKRLAANLTARFSDEGMCLMIECAAADASLAEKLGLRSDIPLHLLRSLLENASDNALQDIVASAPSAQRAEIMNLLEALGRTPPHDDTSEGAARSDVTKMLEDGELDEIALLQFARAEQFVHLMMGLAVLCSVDFAHVQHICHGLKTEELLIPCRAAGVSWNTFRAIALATPSGAALGEHRLAELKKDYARLAPSTSQRILQIRCRQIAAVQPV